MRILVTGNDNLGRISHTAHLSAYGCEVVEAQTYRDAQMILQAGMQPNIIVINLKTDVGAQDFIHNIRMEGYPTSIVVIGSAKDQRALIEEVDMFLERPIETDDLFHHLARTL